MERSLKNGEGFLSTAELSQHFLPVERLICGAERLKNFRAELFFFKQQFAERFSAAPAPRVVIDMNGVSFVDSSGLGALISLLRRVHQDQGEVAIKHLQSSVQTIFDITGAAKMFSIENSPEPAT
ncbi:MAG TPA: STAS domain-containing protein [Candidatus Binatus sp.]|nr:STAS domain-containing protein [Candidatus Binatus sp.]